MEGLLEGIWVFVYFEAARTVPTADADERGVSPMSLIIWNLSQTPGGSVNPTSGLPSTTRTVSGTCVELPRGCLSSFWMSLDRFWPGWSLCRRGLCPMGFNRRPQIGRVEKGPTADLDNRQLASRNHVPQRPLTDAQTPRRLVIAQQELWDLAVAGGQLGAAMVPGVHQPVNPFRGPPRHSRRHSQR